MKPRSTRQEIYFSGILFTLPRGSSVLASFAPKFPKAWRISLKSVRMRLVSLSHASLACFAIWNSAFVFGNPYASGVPFSDTEVRLSAAMRSFWLSFASTGAPTSGAFCFVPVVPSPMPHSDLRFQTRAFGQYGIRIVLCICSSTPAFLSR